MSNETEQTTATDTPNAPAAESMAFRAEIRQLLDILAHSLYTEREIFLRELVSNASDALNRIQFEMVTNRDVRDIAAELAIYVSVDTDANTLTIKDTGIGMDREDVIGNLGTIAQSGARNFLQHMKEQEQKSDADVIGQFGVGFYSVFMVADKVTVISRSYRPDAEAIEWVATGGDNFTVSKGERAERGTTIIIHLKEDAKEFANEWRIRQIIKRHSDFISFPIYMGDEQINQRQPLWRRAPREVNAEEYTSFYQQLTLDNDEPIAHIHVSTDAPVDLHTTLFIPSQRERGMIERRIEGKVKLYSHKVLIQEDSKSLELLPNYYRFIEGVIDSEDVPLNVSRETVQHNPILQRIRKTVTGRVHRELNDLAEKQPDTYARFWQEFGPFIKEGIATDYTDRDELLKLLRFHSTHAEGDALVSLAEYKIRMKDEQEEIYYVQASNLEAARLSPHLEPLHSRNIEVLLMTDIMDSFMLTSLQEYEGKKLRNIDDANLTLPGEDDIQQEQRLDDDAFVQVATHLKTLLGKRVTEVRASKVLRDSPSRLVTPEDQHGREFQRIQKLLGRDSEIQPRIFEINRNHTIIVNLAQRIAANENDPIIAAIAEQLYDNSLLLEGIHPNPSAMVSRLQTLLEAAAASGL